MLLVVLSGPANSGKTTVWNRFLAKDTGYVGIPETEFELLRNMRARFPGNDDEYRAWITAPENYAPMKEESANRRYGHFTGLSASSGFSGKKAALFDRHFICDVGYCEMRNTQPPSNLLQYAKAISPDMVFLFEGPLEFTRRADTGRFMNKEEAMRLYGILKQSYERMGYLPIPVPEFNPDREKNIEARIAFIETNLRMTGLAKK
ncbi:TPA: AAA family ATPase [Candidatus Woesearchaeota archaeon]|nr:AAA family ATPase [Candidatus Woesearchaeota archaeon]QBM01061.1 hypothetical protein [uncultured archaeon]HII65804.1 AAA family ATPase [Candidatus Woesearchaeota archaeon]HIJ19005.1 AAA family ATPase [Candidatus Woesearchaeota archaeon]